MCQQRFVALAARVRALSDCSLLAAAPQLCIEKRVTPFGKVFHEIPSVLRE